MCIVPRNMCTQFPIENVKLFLSYEIRLKFCDTADDANGLTIPKLFSSKNRRPKHVAKWKIAHSKQILIMLQCCYVFNNYPFFF